MDTMYTCIQEYETRLDKHSRDQRGQDQDTTSTTKKHFETAEAATKPAGLATSESQFFFENFWPAVAATKPRSHATSAMQILRRHGVYTSSKLHESQRKIEQKIRHRRFRKFEKELLLRQTSEASNSRNS